VYIGLSARTDEPGATALQALLGSLGRASQVVRTPAATLHLKSDCSLLDEETLLATDELARSGLFDGFRVLVVPDGERAAANAVRVNESVLLRAASPRTEELLVRHGFEVVPLSVAEISRIDAGLSCMSLRWYHRA
jgi:dimethylargininase